MKNGFTIIELILVISIVGVLMAATAPFMSSFILRNSWHMATDRVASEAYKAQNYAMSGKVISGSSVWGVCINGDTFRMFNGSCSVPNFYEDFPFPRGVTITGISSVTFDVLRGLPSVASTILISSNVGSSTVSLGESGMVDVN
jgi:prepilin-type N-terminal cleavage/methylation domain-containing protein